MDYSEFRQQYEEQHPASVPRLENFRMKAEYPAWLTPAAFFMFAASALLSGVHTIPTAYDSITTGPIVSESVRIIASIGSFLFVESGIFMSAFLLISRRKIAVGLGIAVLIVASFIAMAANLRSVNNALQGQDALTQIVTIALGIGAPLVALMGGELFILAYKSNWNIEEKAKALFLQANKEFDAEVLTDWTRYEKKRPRVSISSGLLSASSATGQLTDGQADGQRTATGQGYSKRTDAREAVWGYLEDNPDAVTMNVRQLADILGVGKSTVSDVQRQYKATKNGHGGS